MVIQSLNSLQVVLYAEYVGSNLLWLEQLEILLSMGSREGAML